MSSHGETLREKTWQVIATIESRGLFVHSRNLTIRYQPAGSRDGSTKSIRLPLIVGASVLNALVPRSAILLVGGHGGGKTTLAKLLGRMMTGKSLQQIDDGILRGHPQLTEEKMVATLRPGPLMKDGIEVVVWRNFVTGFWKILDEVNRLTPHAQNILLSMLAEGEVKYYDEVKRCDDYCLFATFNPSDPGTFDMAPPFLDRFGLAVPITMPSMNDLELILASRDERLFGYDELWQVPAILSEEDLLTVWNLADKVMVSAEASKFMRSLVREFGACMRTDKSQSPDLTVETGLCEGCHFNTTKSICNKVVLPISVRAAKDLNRYCKAVAWLVGSQEVGIEIVKSLAPLVFWHRTKYLRENIDRAPFYGDKYAFTQHLVELTSTRFSQRSAAIALIDELKQGKASTTAIDELREMAKSDLLVRMDFTAFGKELKKKAYVKMVKDIDKSIGDADVENLTKLQENLLRQTDFPNRTMLLRRVSDALHRLTLSQFTLTFDQWQELWTNISINFPELTPMLKETLKPPKRKIAKTEGLTLVVYVTGDSPDSAVFLEVSGGIESLKITSEIEEYLAT